MRLVPCTGHYNYSFQMSVVKELHKPLVAIYL